MRYINSARPRMLFMDVNHLMAHHSSQLEKRPNVPLRDFYFMHAAEKP